MYGLTFNSFFSKRLLTEKNKQSDLFFYRNSFDLTAPFRYHNYIKNFTIN